MNLNNMILDFVHLTFEKIFSRFDRYVSTFPQDEAFFDPKPVAVKKFSWSTNRLVSLGT